VLEAIIKIQGLSHEMQHIVLSLNEIHRQLGINCELIKGRPGSETIFCQRRLLFNMMTLNLFKLFQYVNKPLQPFIWSGIADLRVIVDIQSDEKSPTSIFPIKFDDSAGCLTDCRDMVVQFEDILLNLILQEDKICYECQNDDDVWNYDGQLKYSSRYMIYILKKVPVAN
jgi:hypothetical protein